MKCVLNIYNDPSIFKDSQSFIEFKFAYLDCLSSRYPFIRFRCELVSSVAETNAFFEYGLSEQTLSADAVSSITEGICSLYDDLVLSRQW